MTLPRISLLRSTWARLTSNNGSIAADASSSIFTQAQKQQKRFLHLHEFQSMELMKQYGAKTPLFAAAATAREAEAVAYALMKESGNEDCDFVVKAQVLSGGRGLGYFKENGFQGGVQVCTSPGEVRTIAEKMINKTLITRQTGEEGKKCHRVLVAERFFIRKEKYFAILMDSSAGGPLLLGSSVGGTSIEEIAEKHPEAIIKHPINVFKGLSEEEAHDFAKKLGFTKEKAKEAAESIRRLYKMFIERDCLLVEVNPFAETHDGRVLLCDAKVNFDDNADFRQKDIFELRDESQSDPREVIASHYNLNYVGLDGNIGCMVNGAGLAMATMDIIQLHGGKPANFLDVGGGANNEQVVEALRILQNDKKVNSIFINIFGGIMRCDTIALGLIKASQVIGLSKPLVARLEGTNKKAAKQLLEESGMKIAFESDFSEAARKAVKMAQIIDLAKEASLDVSFPI